jgi:putative ABC transport system permease protein
MPSSRATNRAMFWRIIRRLFGANPGRLFVMLLALGAGGAVTAALLNLQVDAKRRLTTEFRTFGPNVLIIPRDSSGQTARAVLDQSFLNRIPDWYEGRTVTKIAVMYLIVSAHPQDDSLGHVPVPSTSVVLVGTYAPDPPNATPRHGDPVYRAVLCKMRPRVAGQLHVKNGGFLELRNGAVSATCFVIVGEGFGNDDEHVFTSLETTQDLAGAANQASQIQLIVSGNPAQIDHFVNLVQDRIPEVEVHPIRQFTEGEAKIYNKISGLLTATVGIVLVLTGLCVMAAMTNVAMERRNDVGLMKAIGGSMRRVLRLFLAEAALLGLAGGMIGAAAGIFLSIGLGKAVFGVAARPRLIVYPVAVALTIIVAILSAYPLRQLAGIRPAAVFRGES